MLQELELPYRVLDLCCGDLGGSSARTFDLEAYAPGVDRWLEVSSVSWFRDYQARRANVRYRPAGGGPPQLVHTVNGSALAWPRIWAALVENGRQEDGTVLLPEAWRPISAGNSCSRRRDAAAPAAAGSGRRSASASATCSRPSPRRAARLATRWPRIRPRGAGAVVPRVVRARPGPPHRRGAVVLGRERAGQERGPALGGRADRRCPRTPTCWPGSAGAPTRCSARCARRAPTRRAGPGGPSRTRRAPWAGTRPRRRRCTAGTPRA